jgi:hypothetical protein
MKRTRARRRIAACQPSANALGRFREITPVTTHDALVAAEVAIQLTTWPGRLSGCSRRSHLVDYDNHGEDEGLGPPFGLCVPYRQPPRFSTRQPAYSIRSSHVNVPPLSIFYARVDQAASRAFHPSAPCSPSCARKTPPRVTPYQTYSISLFVLYSYNCGLAGQ